MVACGLKTSQNESVHIKSFFLKNVHGKINSSKILQKLPFRTAENWWGSFCKFLDELILKYILKKTDFSLNFKKVINSLSPIAPLCKVQLWSFHKWNVASHAALQSNIRKSFNCQGRDSESKIDLRVSLWAFSSALYVWNMRISTY